VTLAHYSPSQAGGDNIVPVFKDVRFDDKVFPDYSFDGVTSSVNKRLQILDDDSGKGPNHGP
jgi:hypothetical protein